MRIGIVSPVVTRVPGAHAEWEREAGITELAEIARAADESGFHHLTCSEHVAVPSELAEQRGGTYWDPLATFGYLAAHTSRIAFATQVLVLGYHHPLAIAKRYGTLDRITGGRLVLGVGVGSLAEEFDLLGAHFADRGARADESIAALRACLGRRLPEFHGRYHDFTDLLVEPHAAQTPIPIWVGGRTKRSLRRATTLADGWVPFGLGTDALADMLTAAEPPRNFEVVLGTGSALDPIGAPEATTQALRRKQDVGATVLTARIRATSVKHYCEQLDALRAVGEDAGAVFDNAVENAVEGRPARSPEGVPDA